MSVDNHAILTLTARHVSALTGQRVASVCLDILGLVLEQSAAAQVTAARDAETAGLVERLTASTEGIDLSGAARAELRAS